VKFGIALFTTICKLNVIFDQIALQILPTYLLSYKHVRNKLCNPWSLFGQW